MTKKITIKDVAKEAGVSHATVSMVFSGQTRISEKTRERVLVVARKLKYVPNLGASNLRKGESKLIGFIVNDIANPAYGKMAQLAETTVLGSGYQLIIADHQWNPEVELAAIQKMISFRARGLLWCSTEQSAASLDLLTSPGSPAVIALDNCPPNYSGAFVGSDVINTGAMAANHLLEMGSRNPVLFTANRGLRNLSNFVDLQKGFLDELRRQGVPHCDERVVYAGLTTKEGREAFYRMQATIPDVDGIFAINDLCAYGVMSGADDIGVQVGKDLALIGIGDHPTSSMPRISLTSIIHSPENVVKTALEELLESFSQNRPPSLRLNYPGELIIRKSSRLARPTAGKNARH